MISQNPKHKYCTRRRAQLTWETVVVHDDLAVLDKQWARLAHVLEEHGKAHGNPTHDVRKVDLSHRRDFVLEVLLGEGGKDVLNKAICG